MPWHLQVGGYQALGYDEGKSYHHHPAGQLTAIYPLHQGSLQLALPLLHVLHAGVGYQLIATTLLHTHHGNN